MSGGSLLNKGLPYDAEIEYLENVDSQQYIDTGLIVSTPYSISCELLADGPLLPNNAYIFWGAGIDYLHRNIECFTGLSKNSVSVCHNGYYDLTYQYNEMPFTVYYRNKVFILTNSQDTVQWTFGGPSYTTPYTMGIFGLHRASWYGSPNPIRFYWFKIENENGITLRDYIPVRVGQVGYMYDRVSGQLFGNAGTGNFILGPDKTN